jgi:hypothetical protein
MARRILNRKELRADYDEAERRKSADDEDVEEEGEEEEDEEEEEAGESESEAGDEEEEEEAPAPKPKKKAPAKPKAKSRSRAAKVVRMRVIWGVFNNSNQQVASYDYPKKQDAVAHAAKLTADKKSTHFVQPVKEAIEEKKE